MEEQNLINMMKQNQISREAQFAQDIQLLRSELQLTRVQLEQTTQQLNLSQDQYSQLKLELSTALAASQIRNEQLTNLLQDQKAELFDYKSNYQQTRSQLDAAREAYIQLQRQAQDADYERQKLQNLYTDLKLNSKKDLELFKQAIVGASHILNQQADFSCVIDTLQNAGHNKTDFILAKLASVAAENNILKDKLVQEKKQNELLENRLKRCDMVTKMAGSGQNPSVQLLYDELSHKETLIQNFEERFQKMQQSELILQRKVQQLVSANQQKEKLIGQYKKNLEEVGELRVMIREMIKSGAK
uniref:Uncharacterized protein n=1 Tax=Trepomonas sp. PC1 TaxID=1076344 RepID=A0A146KFB2_9EUKA|eukprot:JAP94186.1 hypothetical protein TPC1_13262 [Trepomonas sp. PC1]